MKTLKITVVALISILTFNIAKAQVHVSASIGARPVPRHRTVVVTRPIHRPVVVRRAYRRPVIVQRPVHRKVVVVRRPAHRRVVYR